MPPSSPTGSAPFAVPPQPCSKTPGRCSSRTCLWSAIAAARRFTYCPRWSTTDPTQWPCGSQKRARTSGKVVAAAAAVMARAGCIHRLASRSLIGSSKNECCRPSISFSAATNATKPPRPALLLASGSPPASNATASTKSPKRASLASKPTTSLCWATHSFWPSSRPALQHTTPAWCHRSKRWLRRVLARV